MAKLTMSVEEAAEALGISKSAAYNAVHRGEIPSLRIGRRILVPQAGLARYVEEQAIGGHQGLGRTSGQEQ
jgi:excisionase family DNA binding protein